MESIYYVLCWHCHRRCKHCYEERFRPYVRDDLKNVVAQAQKNSQSIIANLPERMTYLELDPEDGNRHVEKPGKIILSGGDVLTDPVRESVLYPALDAIRTKYQSSGGIRVVVQTTGDLLTPKIIDELLQLDIWTISVSGMDDYHVGMEGEKKELLAEKLIAMLLAAGLTDASRSERSERNGLQRPMFSMFGATDDSWIGKLWPRGRAWQNDLSRATLADNFCNAWSGGLNFLNHQYAGSEVSIDPTGDVYPCCIKTASPLGNLVEEPLLEILNDLAGVPALEAINAGKPERMGLTHGWHVNDFLKASQTRTTNGAPYQNLCIGCDQFHREVLGELLEQRRRQRLCKQAGLVASDA